MTSSTNIVLITIDNQSNTLDKSNKHRFGRNRWQPF